MNDAPLLIYPQSSERMLRAHQRPFVLAGIVAVVMCLLSASAFAQRPKLTVTTPPAETEVDPEAAEGRLLSHTRQLTFQGRRAGEGYFSKDSSLMVFQSEREPGNPFFQIYLMDLETGDTERISPGIGRTTCAWIHPDGGRILFASTHEDPEARAKQESELADRAAGKQRRYMWNYDPYFEIYEFDLKTREYNRLTHAPGYDAEGSWSPDGKKILFASNRHAYATELSPELQEILDKDPSYFMEIYLMDADGSNVRRLTDVEGYDGGPFFSADGTKICWRRFAPNGATAEIFVADADGSNPRQVTHMQTMAWAPFFHPSGKYLIYTTNKHGFGNFELYIVDTEGKHEPVRATYTKHFDGLPVFSPDGDQLAWTSSRPDGENGQIFIADWDHAEALRLLKQSPARRDEALLPQAQSKPEDAARETVGDKPAITPEELQTHVERLASEALQGRLTGTEGERLATAYVAEAFKRIGLRPAGDNGTYFQSFEFTAGASLGENNRLKYELKQDGKGGAGHEVKLDAPVEITQDMWRPLAFSRTGQVKPAPVVFAGYGLVAPGKGEIAAYNSFEGLEIEGKWVMVFRFLPEGIRPELRQHWNRYASLRHKAMMVRDMGGHGLIVVSGPNSGVKEQLVKLEVDTSMATMSLPAVSITDELADAILASVDTTVKQLQGALDDGEPRPGLAIPDVVLRGNIDIEKVRKTGRNVLARLPASPRLKDRPAVVIGAHVDHLGLGIGTNSRGREDEIGKVHHGADDNASGVAALIEIAEYLMHMEQRGRLPLERDVVFAAWSGEELGLLGSEHYVNQVAAETGKPGDISSKVAACLNMDMIGRLEEMLMLSGAGSSTVWAEEIERRNAPVGLPIELQDDTYLPTDATSFYLKRVPILSAYTGAHDDYHTPRDTPDKLDYASMAKVAKLFALVTRGLALRAEAPEYIEVAAPDRAPARANLRATLGTMPDYVGGEVPGVELSAVSKGGPADQAGLLQGDVVVELAGRKIENIYDYTYAIEALKVGEPVAIVVLRAGERKEFTITPGSRE